MKPPRRSKTAKQREWNRMMKQSIASDVAKTDNRPKTSWWLNLDRAQHQQQARDRANEMSNSKIGLTLWVDPR